MGMLERVSTKLEGVEIEGWRTTGYHCRNTERLSRENRQ